MARTETATADVSYTEEDGYKITRGNEEYFVYGTIEAEYTWSHTPETRWDPADDDITRTGDIEISCIKVCDANGNDVEIQLTEQERALFDDYMSSELDDKAWGPDPEWS